MFDDCGVCLHFTVLAQAYCLSKAENGLSDLSLSLVNADSNCPFSTLAFCLGVWVCEHLPIPLG